ncbi:signal transduction histidine kinase [Chitinophaga skermanii]|uniref:histidine kinase n=1 Tax=Chitinophaga skermanii TaxID=331697 RepID=A0A327QAD2_9BACT|nr:HAMP domain-containing sensor histidine kinase [Chitinophaga skermanii]RAJ01596.1 signal transduction histidine kinase [Chitinophaga skermanii]
MKNLLNLTLRRSIIYASIVLAGSIPVYYFILNKLWLYEMDEHNIILTEEAGKEDSFLIISAVTILTVIFFGLLIGGLVLMNRRISKRLWTPFYDSLAKIKGFDLNKQTPIQFEETGITEFAELNKNLQKLLTSSISAYNQQKEFVDNASHELQTPLAIVQSKLDLLLQSQSLTADQYDIIEDAHKALTRVSRINKNLLLLARIDNSQYNDNETFDLSNAIEKSIDLSTQFADVKQLHIESDIQPSQIVTGNKALIEILINNLLNNAIRHSTPNGTIHISLKNNEIRFANNGSDALQSDQLFKRFGTANSQTPGTGLGLALVKQIAERHQWKVGYQFFQQQHIFTVAI